MTHSYPDTGTSNVYTLDALNRLTRAMRVTNHVEAIRRATPPHQRAAPGTGAHRPEHLGPFAVPVDHITRPRPVIHQWDTNPFPCCTKGPHA